MNYHLAIDMGASSGRLILGWLEKDSQQIHLEEIHRFENGVSRKNGHLCWDFEHLFQEIRTGMKLCRSLGKIPSSVGIDTWGVDFVLLDENGQVLGDTVAYRDRRTEGMPEEIGLRFGERALYERTGIQPQDYNTIYQLAALDKESPELLKQTSRILMTPEYFSYLLSGEMVNEYTICSTTGMLSKDTRDWDDSILSLFPVKRSAFDTPVMPGTKIGRLRPDLAEEVGFDCDVILPACHDTGSAVLAVPSNDADFIFLSSGTWSILGTELANANTSKEAEAAGFSNEGGVNGTIRFSQNIMGLWMLQSVRNEYKSMGTTYTFPQLAEYARIVGEFPARINVNDDCFLAPDSMITEIKEYCRRTHQAVPESVGEICSLIYHGLASCYAKAISFIEAQTGKNFSGIYIVGGGCQDLYLNELTAKYSGKQVFAGPIEATAMGNLAAQMIAGGELKDVAHVREIISSYCS